MYMRHLDLHFGGFFLEPPRLADKNLMREDRGVGVLPVRRFNFDLRKITAAAPGVSYGPKSYASTFAAAALSASS